MQQRPAIEDEAHLAGQQIQLDEPANAGEMTAETTESYTGPAGIERELTDKVNEGAHNASASMPANPSFDDVDTQRFPAQTQLQQGPTNQSHSSGQPSRNKESLTGPILTGLFVGGIVGLLILSVIALLYLGEPHQ